MQVWIDVGRRDEISPGVDFNLSAAAGKHTDLGETAIGDSDICQLARMVAQASVANQNAGFFGHRGNTSLKNGDIAKMGPQPQGKPGSACGAAAKSTHAKLPRDATISAHPMVNCQQMRCREV